MPFSVSLICRALRLIFAGAILTCVLCVAQEPQQSESKPAPSPTDQGELATHKIFPFSKIKENVIGEVTAGSSVAWARSTENHLAWAEKAKNGSHIVRLDGKQVGTIYDDVSFLEFSDDQEHLIWNAKRGSKWQVVIDGEDKTKPYGKLTPATINANGKHFAAGACEQKRCKLLVDGEETGPEFEEISYPTFSKDGAHCVYAGKRNKQWILLLDGKQLGPEMRDFYSWKFSPDYTRVAVAALFKEGWTWVVDGVAGSSYEVLSSITFTKNGKHYAFAGTNSKSAMFGKNKTAGTLVVDGKVEQTYEGRGFGGGWQGAFATYRMVTGVRSLLPDFHGLSDPTYAGDGSLVYAARRGDDNVVVFFHGQAGPAVEDLVSPIIITEDGLHLAYVVKRGEQFVQVLDQKLGSAFPGQRVASFVPYIMIAPDGSRVAYEIARGGNRFKEGYTQRALRRLVVDNKADAEFDAYGITNVVFNSDRKHYAYEVIGGSGDRDTVVVDGMEGKYYDSVFRGSTKFIQDDTIEYLARDGGKFYRIQQTLN
jgi:hypothetical protein